MTESAVNAGHGLNCCIAIAVAAFVAWLAGPENSCISGQNIAIDGGYSRT